VAQPEPIKGLSRSPNSATGNRSRTAAVPIACPFCRAESSELISLFGSQLLLSQYRCTACGSYFEGLRQDQLDTEPLLTTPGGPEDDGS
jgi:transposase-like protein